MHRIKLDLDDVPAPQGVTGEGFCDYTGTATIGDVVLDYPLEKPLLRQWRPSDEVLSDAALASIEHKPIVNSHPRDARGQRVFVTPENAAQFTRGVVKRAWRDGNKLRLELRIFDAQLLADVRAGKCDLSPGYDCETVPGAGVTPDGVPYDATQRGHHYNHVAVEYRGRNPGARLTADGEDMTMEEMMAIIEGDKLSPEDLAVLKAKIEEKLGAAPPVDDAGPPAAGGGGGAPDVGELVKRIEKLEKGQKADGLDIDALGSKIAKTAAKGLRTITDARDLARPILGQKADAIDDPATIHRDMIVAVFPEMKADVEADFTAGRTEVLARTAAIARSHHNRKITADAADQLHSNRDPGATPQSREEREKAMATALTPNRDSKAS